MRIAFVCPWVPSPVRPRSYGLLRRLARDHEVWLVCAVGRDEETSHLDDLGLHRVTVVRRHLAGGVARTLLGLARGRSLQVSLLDEPGVRRAVARIERDWRPDVFHFNVIRSAGALRAVRRTPVVFDLDEIRSDYYDQLRAGSRSVAWRWLARLELPLLRRAEQQVAARSACALVSSPVDVDRPACPTRLVRSPHDVAIGADHHDGPHDRPHVLFVGRLGYQANREALDWFTTEVWPGVRERVPQARLVVVGESPGHLRTDESRGIEVTGRVDTVDPFYAAAAVAIVPVALGTGVQMKLVQGLAAGTTVVTTEHCAVQAGVPSGAVVVAGTAAEWSERVAAALIDPTGHRTVREAGRRWVAKAYDLERIHASLLAAYDVALPDQLPEDLPRNDPRDLVERARRTS